MDINLLLGLACLLSLYALKEWNHQRQLLHYADAQQLKGWTAALLIPIALSLTCSALLVLGGLTMDSTRAPILDLGAWTVPLRAAALLSLTACAICTAGLMRWEWMTWPLQARSGLRARR